MPFIAVVGGVYEEYCLRPAWHEVYGSAGRAASAIASSCGGSAVQLHCYLDEHADEIIASRCAMEGSSLVATRVPKICRFRYIHGLARPDIDKPSISYKSLNVQAPNVLRFGMLEGDSIVNGDWVVYDPQSARKPAPFHANGSVANKLAVVVNEHEASIMTGLRGASGSDLAREVQRLNDAHVVVLKRGPLGALVLDDSHESSVPAFATRYVWKLGSGDIFSGHFAARWALERRSAAESAELASKATALYCLTGGFPRDDAIEGIDAPPVFASQRFQQGYVPSVYLAGPFFTLAQLWMVEQARTNLQHFGLRVFSPYHDVGYGSAMDVVEQDLEALGKADIVFAIADGLDSGTVYEIGYARARDIPVVVYSENEGSEDLKMMEGSGCAICDDYVSAIYQALWTAISL